MMWNRRIVQLQRRSLGKLWKVVLVPMLLLVAFLGVMVYKYSSDTSPHFHAFVEKYQKLYTTYDEFQIRQTIFLENLERIERFNEEHEHMKLGVNQFADKTMEELWKEDYPERPSTVKEFVPPLRANPDDMNWVEQGKVTEVKNERHCAASWIFAAVGAAESLNAINNEVTPVEYSEQDIEDCHTQTAAGCTEFPLTDALKYIQDNGLAYEAVYPWEAARYNCRTRTAALHISGYEQITTQSANDIVLGINTAPILSMIDANSFEFRFYREGVFNSTSCTTTPNHSLLLVGFASPPSNENDEDTLNADPSAPAGFYLAKNSWGTSWGEGGYVRIYMDDKNGPGVCGIQQQAYFLVLEGDKTEYS